MTKTVTLNSSLCWNRNCLGSKSRYLEM